ncbi:hypothetical protein TrRE_jg7994 [Triparma retinervis]|uniref:Uncharacterized protein n=1 Tax=Triparma retinervis TaxID=2557542 RepID=A0A9W7AAP4_9STRA|nr:hypothetical protein TrRE_jg7994 [Triparma retinervis]
MLPRSLVLVLASFVLLAQPSRSINSVAFPEGEEVIYKLSISANEESHGFWPGNLEFGANFERVDGLSRSSADLEVCFSSSTEGMNAAYKLVEGCTPIAGNDNWRVFGVENGRHTVVGALFEDGRMVSKPDSFVFHVSLREREPPEILRECKAAEGTSVAGLLLREMAAEDGLAYGTHRNADYLRRLTVEGGVVGTVSVVHEEDDPRMLAERARGGVLEDQVGLLERGVRGGCAEKFNFLDGGTEGVVDGLKPSFVVLDGGGGREGYLVQLISKWYSAPSVKMIVVSNYSLCEVLKRQPSPPHFDGGDSLLTSNDELVVIKGGRKSEAESESEPGSKNAIVVVSVSHPSNLRPWTQLVIKRISSYAKKCGCDLVIYEEIDVAGCDASSFRLCAMLMKLKALKRTLGDYDRVMLLDDTALVRGDTPDLFQVVPEDLVGGMYESFKGGDVEKRFLGEVSEFYGLMAEGAGGGNGHVMNTGVMVLSKKHHFDMLFNNSYWNEEQYVRLDASLLGDQGYVNAMMLREWGWNWGGKVMDLGPRFNYVGSFENINRMKVDFRSEESYIVHATTGLLVTQVAKDGALETYEMITDENGTVLRVEYLKDIDEKWGVLGL